MTKCYNRRQHPLRTVIAFCIYGLAMLAGQCGGYAQSQQAVNLVVRAEQAFNKNQYEQTIALCREAIKLSPRYARAHSWQGAAHRRRYLVLLRNPGQQAAAERHRQAAINSFQQVLQIQPNGADADVAKAGINELTPRPPAPTLESLYRARVTVNGKPFNLLTPLILSPSRRLLIAMQDFERIFECKGTYRVTDRSILLQGSNNSAWLKANDHQAIVDGAPFQLNQPPILLEDQVFVPVELLEKFLRPFYEWDDKNQILRITKGSVSGTGTHPPDSPPIKTGPTKEEQEAAEEARKAEEAEEARKAEEAAREARAEQEAAEAARKAKEEQEAAEAARKAREEREAKRLREIRRAQALPHKNFRIEALPRKNGRYYRRLICSGVKKWDVVIKAHYHDLNEVRTHYLDENFVHITVVGKMTVEITVVSTGEKTVLTEHHLLQAKPNAQYEWVEP